MATKSKVIPASSADVRDFFARNPKKVPAGSEKCVQPNQRGRLTEKAVAVYHAENKGRRYVEGTKAHMPLTYKAGNHRMVTEHLPMREIRAWAGKPGSRGPLSEDDISFASETYGEHKRKVAKAGK